MGLLYIFVSLIKGRVVNIPPLVPFVMVIIPLLTIVPVLPVSIHSGRRCNGISHTNDTISGGPYAVTVSLGQYSLDMPSSVNRSH